MPYCQGVQNHSLEIPQCLKHLRDTNKPTRALERNFLYIDVRLLSEISGLGGGNFRYSTGDFGLTVGECSTINF